MTASENLALSTNDPLLREIELPCRATQYPLGFPLYLATNSHDVIEAADEAWGLYAPEFDRQALNIRIVVQPGGSLADGPPAFRAQGELYSIVYDRDNFGVYETKSMAGYCFVSEKTAANHLRFRLHFLEAMVYSLLAQRHAVPMHAAAVVRHGSGFLLCGPSCAGKSSLAFACARSGWTLVSDDATWLPADAEGRTAIGKPHHARFREDAPRLFPELARYVAEQRPNGKITIEAPASDFPDICTAVRCPVDRLVRLDRRLSLKGAPARAVPISAAEVVESILADMPSYGRRVRQMYERTLGRLLDASAWRIEYETLDQALELLSEIDSK